MLDSTLHLTLHVKKLGFSLIELLMVISIIGILASIAMPSYNNYLVKAKIVKALTLLNNYKLNIAEHYIVNGNFPTRSQDVFDGKTSINTENSNNDIKSINYELKNGSALISATLKSAPQTGKDHVYFKGKIENHIISWNCTGVNLTNSIPEQYYPKSCKNNS